MIIAKRDDDRIIVAVSIADCSVDMTVSDLVLQDNLPIHKVRGEKDCYICAKSISLDFDILRFNDKIFRGIEDGNTVLKKVVPQMKSLLDSYPGFSSGYWCGTLLIIKGATMYIIDADFCVSEERDEYCACNSSIPQGALYALRNSSLGVTERILEAMRCSCLMQDKLFPAVIFDTKTNKRKAVVYK